MKNILVTGGAGYIGSHMCLRLLEKGYNVFVIDSLGNGSLEALERIKVYYKKLNKKNKLHFFKVNLKIYLEIFKAFEILDSKGINIDAVLHFAGHKSVFKSIENPIEYWDNNVAGTLNLLRILDNYNCKAFIFSSSATVYGIHQKSPISEDSDTKPLNPYGETKLAVEKILKSFFISSSSKTSIASLRYFNPIGAHESSIIGEDPKGVPDNLFPYICKVANGELENLNVFGSDWPTEDGTCIRDFIHIMDLVDGHIKTLEYLSSNKPCSITLNLGTGKGTSVLDLIKSFEKVNKIKLSYSFEKRRNGDVPVIYADPLLAEELIGWKAKKSINDMCLDGWNWNKMNPKGYKLDLDSSSRYFNRNY